MAIKFQFNKTSLNDLNKQLKIRVNALPTLKNKESALRLEVKRAKDRSDELAEKLLSACDAGDLAALKELGDRLDGKANQSISGPDGEAIPVGIKVSYERPSEVS